MGRGDTQISCPLGMHYTSLGPCLKGGVLCGNNDSHTTAIVLKLPAVGGLAICRTSWFLVVQNYLVLSFFDATNTQTISN